MPETRCRTLHLGEQALLCAEHAFAPTDSCCGCAWVEHGGVPIYDLTYAIDYESLGEASIVSNR